MKPPSNSDKHETLHATRRARAFPRAAAGRLTRLGNKIRSGLPARGKTIRPSNGAPAAPKTPPDLPQFFMLSHLEDDAIVRIDGTKTAVLEATGAEIDEPKTAAFAAALNALDFPVQFLIRQHPPRLQRIRADLLEAQPTDMPEHARDAANSLQRLLLQLESRDGILDRRFYALCDQGRADELQGLLARAGISVQPLQGRQLRMLATAAALGGSPSEMPSDQPVSVKIESRRIRIGSQLMRSLHLNRWPRTTKSM